MSAVRGKADPLCSERALLNVARSRLVFDWPKVLPENAESTLHLDELRLLNAMGMSLV
jgi:hypothetical protein